MLAMAHPLEVEVLYGGLGLCARDHARAVLVKLLERANNVLLHDTSEFLLVQPITGLAFRQLRDAPHISSWFLSFFFTKSYALS